MRPTRTAPAARPAAARPVARTRTVSAPRRVAVPVPAEQSGRGRARVPRTLMAPPRRVTARAAIVAAVLGALLLSAALPLREYLNQRGEITTLQQDQAAARARLAELEAERERLNDPAYIAAEARRRLQFVLPGETAYQLILPSPEPSAADGRGTGSGPNAPWYSQVWGSVREADRPAPAPSP